MYIVGHRRTHTFQTVGRNEISRTEQIGIQFRVSRAEQCSNTGKVFLSEVQICVGVGLLRSVVNERTIEEYTVSVERNTARCNNHIVDSPSRGPFTVIVGMEVNPYAVKTAGTGELSKVNLEVLPCTGCRSNGIDYCPGSTGVGADLNVSALSVFSGIEAGEVQTEGRKSGPVHFGGYQIVAASVSVGSIIICHSILGVRRNGEV